MTVEEYEVVQMLLKTAAAVFVYGAACAVAGVVVGRATKRSR